MHTDLGHDPAVVEPERRIDRGSSPASSPGALSREVSGQQRDTHDRAEPDEATHAPVRPHPSRAERRRRQVRARSQRGWAADAFDWCRKTTPSGSTNHCPCEIWLPCR